MPSGSRSSQERITNITEEIHVSLSKSLLVKMLEDSPSFPWSDLGFEGLLLQEASFSLVSDRFGENMAIPGVHQPL